MMKKLLPLLLFLAMANVSKATLTFTLVTAPCDSNGVLAVTYTGTLLPTFQTEWVFGAHSAYHAHVTGFTDTLRNYGGGTVTLTWIDSATGMTDTGTYYGASPVGMVLSSTNATCPVLGTATATVTAGTGPFTYQWYDYFTHAIVGTTATVNLPSGFYGVWVTNGAGCGSGSPITGTFVTINDTSTFHDSLAATTASCTNGTATLGGVMGTYTTPLSYLWSNGATSSTITGLTTGYYSLKLTDASGCSYTSSVYVPQSVAITVGATPTAATCLSDNGAIAAFAGGGTPPYSYVWSNGATTQNQTGLTAGYYSVVATDANGCTGSGGGSVTASTPIVVTYTAMASSCTVPTGMATLTISGGTAPYHDTIYSSPIQIATVATALAPGTYDFHVVDAVGCIQNGSVVVPPADVIIAGMAPTPATCTLSNGSLTVSPTGGVAPYSYSWSTGATGATLSGVPSGSYYVTITDANSCTANAYATVGNYSPVTVGVSSVPASCIFTSDGVLTATPYGGTAPYSYTWTGGGTTSTITLMPTGPYWVNVTDASGCTAVAYDYLGYNAADSSCFCTIKGTIYHDVNVNCVQDSGEYGIPNVQVACATFGYTYTDDSGRYSFIVPSGTYTVSETVQAFYPLSGCQMNNIPVTVTAATGCVHTVDFANILDTLHDVQISVWDWSHPVPGDAYTQIGILHNGGSVTETVPVASYRADSQIYGATFTPSTIFGGGGAYYDYSTLTGGGLATLAPGASQVFYANYNVPTFVPLGTVLTFTDTASYIAPLDSWITDYAPWNNVNEFTTVTRSSHDPNFKEVTPAGYGSEGIITTADSNLEFMIHFQNTGTAQAQNIVIKDTLSANLDLTSLRPIYSTSPCTITQNATAKVVTFTFHNIDLPVNASGMVTYSIKLKPGLPYGSQIKNSASIYFDYNAPVQTNTTLNTIGWPLNVPTTHASDDFFNVFPNPTANTFTAAIRADVAGTAQLNVSDITGKLLVSKSVTLAQGMQQVTMDVSNFASGMYLVTVNTDDKVQTRKLAVVR